MYVTQYMSIYVKHVVSMARKIKSKTSLKKAVQIVTDKTKPGYLVYFIHIEGILE